MRAKFNTLCRKGQTCTVLDQTVNKYGDELYLIRCDTDGFEGYFPTKYFDYLTPMNHSVKITVFSKNKEDKEFKEHRLREFVNYLEERNILDPIIEVQDRKGILTAIVRKRPDVRRRQTIKAIWLNQFNQRRCGFQSIQGRKHQQTHPKYVK